MTKALLLLCATFFIGVGAAFASGTTEAAAGEQSVSQTNEAPMLKAMVDAGELPSLSERLPREPLVVEPVDGIGKYGGYLQHARTITHSDWYMSLFVREPLTNYSLDLSHPIPNVVKAFEISDDGTQTTFSLREGMKWSDGEPFTADDIMFWYEDQILNDEMTPVKPSRYKRAGELVVMTKIDDYTVQATFAKPYAMFAEIIGAWPLRSRPQYGPKHYLKQFHASYVSSDDLNKVVREAGFTSWTELLESRKDINSSELPSLGQWLPTNDKSAPIQKLVRNPYYWKVDTAGNQLPYIDGVERPLVGDIEAKVLKIVAGESDLGHGNIIDIMPNYTLFMENRDSGNYRLVEYLWQPDSVVVYFNYTTDDAAKRSLYNDLRFRIAMSVAMDRSAINTAFYRGQAHESQITPPHGPPYHGERDMFKKYTEYDPDMANRLLDEIGITARDDEGFRLGPDGNKLTIVNFVNSDWPTESPEVAEMLKDWWAEIGIRTVVQPQAGQLWYPMHTGNQHDMSMRGAHYGGGPIPPAINPNAFALGGTGWQYSPMWGLWLATGGAEGIEPPDEVKKLREIQDRIFSTADQQEKMDLYTQAFSLHTDNLWAIGVNAQSGFMRKWVFSNRIKNIPEVIESNLYSAQFSTWYLDD